MTLTQGQRIELAKAIGWDIRPRCPGYYLYTPEPDIYTPDDDEADWLPVKTETDAWALLPDDPLEWWLEEIAYDRDFNNDYDKEECERAIKEAQEEYRARLDKNEAKYQLFLAAALAASREYEANKSKQ